MINNSFQIGLADVIVILSKTTAFFVVVNISFPVSPQSFTSAPRRGNRSEDPSVFHFILSRLMRQWITVLFFGFVKPDVLKNVELVNKL